MTTSTYNPLAPRALREITSIRRKHPMVEAHLAEYGQVDSFAWALTDLLLEVWLAGYWTDREPSDG